MRLPPIVLVIVHRTAQLRLIRAPIRLFYGPRAENGGTVELFTPLLG